MDEIERSLRELPLRSPGPRLDARMRALFASRRALPARRPRLARVVAVCALAGAIGFAAGRMSAPESPPRVSTRVEVVHDSTGRGNFFDLTTVEEEFVPWTVTVR